MPFCAAEEEGQFNPEAPTLSTLPRILVWRIEASNTTIFDELINPWLFEGKDSACTLQSCCAAFLVALENEDVMLMQEAAAAQYEELCITFQGLIVIASRPFCSDGGDAVRALCGQGDVKEARGGPVEKVRVALKASEYFKGQAEAFLESLPLILEKEGDMVAHRECLSRFEAEGSDIADVAWEKPLNSMCRDLGCALQRAPLASLGDLATRACDAAKRHAQAILDDMSSGLVTATDFDNLQKLLHEASIVSPLDTSIQDLVHTLSQRRVEINHTAHEKKLVDAMDDALAADAGDNAWGSVHAALSHCAGMTLGADTMAKLLSMLSSLAGLCCKCVETDVETATTCLTVMDEALRFVNSRSAWRHMYQSLQYLVALRAHSNVVEGRETSTEAVAAFRKALEDVRNHKQKRLVVSDDMIAADLKLMLATCEATFVPYAEKNQDMLRSAATLAESQMAEACGILETHAFGKTVGGVWHIKASQKTSLDQLHKLAEDAQLQFIDRAKTQEAMAEAQGAIDSFKEAMSACGGVLEVPTLEKCEGLIKRAALTLAEQRLMETAAHPPQDKDVLRGVIQDAIKGIRAYNIKEKDALPTALFKWALSALTGRH